MPNVFSCDPAWTKKLVNEQETVVLVAWSEKSGMNGLTEKLAELEQSTKVPVMVVDCDACQQIPEAMGMKPGEVAVFKSGKEVGKIASSADSNLDVVKIREIASR